MDTEVAHSGPRSDSVHAKEMRFSCTVPFMVSALGYMYREGSEVLYESPLDTGS